MSRVHKTEADFPYLRTIHAICYRQLNIGKDQIVTKESIRKFGRAIGLPLTGTDHDPWAEDSHANDVAPTRDDVLIQINHMGRHRKFGLKEALKHARMPIDEKYAIWFTNGYRDWKYANGLLDYTDLLVKYNEWGKPLPIDVIFVDEAQDLSALQWDAVKKLGANAKRWYIAGDDDQAIFHWAGADATAFQEFKVDKTEVLDQSYRLSKAVHDFSMRIVQRIKKRIPKEYKATPSEGEVRKCGFLKEVTFKKKSFILFRNHFRGNDLSNYLNENEIPFIGRNSPLLDPNVRAALLGFYQLLKNGESASQFVKQLIRFSDEEYFRPKIKELVKKEKIISIEDVFEREPKPIEFSSILSELPDRDTIMSYIRKYGLASVAAPKIELLSLHQSKGREAHTVVLDPEMSRATWLNMAANTDDEHRVWYVGATRAKEQVLLLLSEGNYSYKF